MKRINLAVTVLVAAFVTLVVNMVFTARPAHAHAFAPAMTTFSSGNVLTASALNANFQHLDNWANGNIVNANISATAAISHSKLATPGLMPKAWAQVGTLCAAGTCTLDENTSVTSIAWSAAGDYNVTLAYTPINAAFVPQVTSHTVAAVCIATTTAAAAPHFKVRCFDYAGAATNAAFSILVMDT